MFEEFGGICGFCCLGEWRGEERRREGKARKIIGEGSMECVGDACVGLELTLPIGRYWEVFEDLLCLCAFLLRWIPKFRWMVVDD